jgi:hypothetical protein
MKTITTTIIKEATIKAYIKETEITMEVMIEDKVVMY